MGAVTWIAEQTVGAGLYPYHFPRKENGDEMACFPQLGAYIVFFAQDQVGSREHKKQGGLIVI